MKQWAFITVLLLLVGCQNTGPGMGASERAQSTTEMTVQEWEQLGETIKTQTESARLRQQYFRQKQRLLRSRSQSAMAQLRAGDRPGALDTLREMRRIDRSSPLTRRIARQALVAQRHAQWLAQAQSLAKSDQFEKAVNLAQAVSEENPDNAKADRLLRDLRERWQLAEGNRIHLTPKLNKAFKQPVSLNFRGATLAEVFEALRLATGINFLFDKDVKTDTPVTLAVTEKPVDSVFRILQASYQLARSNLDSDTVLIYPNTPEKARDYEQLLIRTFYFRHANASKAAKLLQQLVNVRDVYVDERLNMLIVRDSPRTIRLAQQVLANIDLSEPEVVLELEVLEVTRNRLSEIGVQFPTSVGIGVSGASGGPTLTLPEWQNRDSNLVRLQFNDPLAVLNLRRSRGETTLLANPRIRIQNKKSAKVLVGERVPIITTTTTANVGASESVSYLDVGLKLDLTPSITPDNEVTMAVALEVSSITGSVTRASGLQAFRLGTRTASTQLRVRHGETQIIGGLIQRDERATVNAVPGLADLPIVGRLFSSNTDDVTRTEIVLLITPHVVRNAQVPNPNAMQIRVGTESSFGRAGSVTPTGATSFESMSESQQPMEQKPAPLVFPPPSPTRQDPAADQFKSRSF